MTKLYAISDLHLSGARPKPMDIFGPGWENHVARVEENWRKIVRPEDIVLIAGDISWAMRLPEAMVDLKWLGALPGQKVMIKGNHDFWWQTIGKLRKALAPGMYCIQHDAVRLGDFAFGGTRLWDFPGINWPPDPGMTSQEPTPGTPQVRPGTTQNLDPEKIRARELDRLRMSLSSLPHDARWRVLMTHYPPIGDNALPTLITDIIDEVNVDLCVFGPLHAPGNLPRP